MPSPNLMASNLIVLVKSEIKRKIFRKIIQKREPEVIFFNKVLQENDCFKIILHENDCFKRILEENDCFVIHYL